MAVVVVAMSTAGKPLLSAQWFRVAAVRPRLRDHVRITRQHFRGDRWFVLEDLVENSVHRYAPAAQAAIGLMDGTHTLDGIWTSLAELGEERPTQDELIHLMAQLDAANLLATERLPDFAELSDRARRQSSSKLWRRLANPLYLRIPICDPDRFLDATLGLARPLWSIWGFLLWLAVVGWGAIQAALHWTELTHDLADRVLAHDNLLILAVTFPLLKLLHELGHCYAAKVGGASVHEAGIMTLVVMPVPYVDVSPASAFSNKWRRALVGAAGMLTELFCAGLAMMVWTNVEPGLARAAAFNCMLIAGVSTLLFNGNPLLRFDAYFILSDLIEIPNLGARSIRYYGYLVNRYAFGVRGQTSPVQARGEAPWFAFYGVASYVYRLWVMISIALFVAVQMHGVGAVLAAWTVVSGIVYPLARGVWQVTRGPALQPHRLRALMVSGAIAACVALLLFGVKLPYGTVTQGVVWAPAGADLRAGAEGSLANLLAAPDASLAAGDPVARLTDPVLDARVQLLVTQLREVQLRYTAAEPSDRVQAQMLRQQIVYFQSQLEEMRARRKALSIAAPVAGRFLVSMPRDLDGRFIRRGELIGYVLDDNAVIVRIIVPQSEIELVRDDTRGVDLRFASRPMRVLHVGQVTREVPTATRQLPSVALASVGGGPIAVDPADEQHLRALEMVFQMDVKLPQGVGDHRIGERVYVRFQHGDRTLAWRISRTARQLFLRRFDL
ncbi:MAG: putative peptide zinc metalloprotease protein [Acetobacteraceae bacterium]|nr:putative peptide zinc metalloprotease protein [Acetobacteraceae bacterium]